MTCRAVRRRLSAHLDGDLRPAAAQAVQRHLDGCARCALERERLHAVLMALSDLPRLEPAEAIASRVFDRLEVESRGPGLALLFRPAWAARPLMLPSLVPAVLVLALTLLGVLWLDSEPELPAVAPSTRLAWSQPPIGTEGNPLSPMDDVNARRRDGFDVPDDVFAGLSEGSGFFAAVVARDGSVSDVVLLDGNSATAGPLLDALRRERFEPARLDGRPVAVSVYRLISRMEVRAPLT